MPDAPPLAPTDGNQLRGFHFRRLLRKPLTQSLVIAAMVVGAVVGAAAGGPSLGALAAVAALLAALIVVLKLADSRAEDSFFATYASERGLLLLSGRGQLPPATPLLRKGDERYADRVLNGPLAPELDGTLALYTYVTESSDGQGGQNKQYHRYTVALAEVPGCASFVPELYCHRKVGFRALEKLEDAFHRNRQRVELESEAIDERYEIFCAKGQDRIWLRQLFSPTFIVWLANSAPDDFAFELAAGTLCCYVKGHQEDATHLDAVRTATAAVAARLREETLEERLPAP